MTALGYLSTVDKLIIAAYFVTVLAVGIYFSKLASKGLNNYFLGDRAIPWWALGLSGTASNFDMTGTMVIVSFFFAITHRLPASRAARRDGHRLGWPGLLATA